MKKVLFRKRMNLKKRIKTFSIYSRSEDQECKTQVKKGFAYAVDRAKETRPVSKPPLIFIRKSFDTKKAIETFSFHVKGYFFVTYKRELIRVRFYHTLEIEIKWKAGHLLSKKTESLA